MRTWLSLGAIIQSTTNVLRKVLSLLLMIKYMLNNVYELMALNFILQDNKLYWSFLQE